MRVKGILHVHSRHSFDGQHSLEEIAEFARGKGYGFVCVTEHSDTLTEQLTREMVAHCHAVSTPDCLILPGIEFTCDNNLHVLGLGIEKWTPEKRPYEVATFIREHGGIGVVAHPRRYKYDIPPELRSVVQGIEIWNAGYDGRFVPNKRSLHLLMRWRNDNPALWAYGGQDLHSITDKWHVEVTVDCDRLEKACVLRALRDGNFVVENPLFSVKAQILPGPMALLHLSMLGACYSLLRRLRA